VRPAGLYAISVLLRLGGEGVGELVQLLRQRQRELEMREAHGGRRHVVRRLRDVHVVVRADVLVRPQRAAEDLVRAVRDDLVRVHVERHASAGLEDIDHELIGVTAGENLVARGHDGVTPLRVQAARLAVRECRGLLHADDRSDERGERAIAADRIVVDRSPCLRTPQRVRGDRDLTERIALTTGRHVNVQ